MAALEVLALNTVIPQIQAPQVGDSYLFPRVAEFSAGTALLPSLAATGDLDTGMWFPAANTVAWSTGGLEAMRIDSSGQTVTGNLTFSGTGRRIIGDFSSATLGQRVYFQTNASNAASVVSVLPNGTGSITQFAAYSGSDPANSQVFRLEVRGGSECRLASTFFGTPVSGTTLPITFWSGNTEQMRINVNGNVGIGTSSPSQKLDVIGQIRATLGVTVDGGTANNGAVAISTSNNQSLGGPAIYFLGASNGTLFAASGTQQGSVNFYGPQYSGGCAITAFATENQNATSLGGELRIYTTPNGTTAQQERMRITSAGNVGIGTSSPAASLHLYSASAFQPQVIVENEASGDSGAYFIFDKGRSNAAVVAADNLGNLLWRCRDSNGALQNSSFIYALASTVAAGSVTSSIHIASSADTLIIGGNITRLRVKADGQTRFVPLAADPTVNVEDGDVYYNSGTNKLRLRAAGAWVDLN